MNAELYSVRAESLSKRYRIGTSATQEESLAVAVAKKLGSPLRNLRDLRRLRRFGAMDDTSVIWAVRDVSFELHPGDVLGVMGRNGAGKSTLLKLLARITEPSEGRALLRGRVASLLEVGTGFHGDLTGRENVFLNGTMLGMRRREIIDRFDEIVDFAGISRFIDTPVKRYSSGMYVRLAFAVAAHLEPDVLIADEVLAVGDSEFQRKCLGKMREVAGGGRTVVFVSHNQASVASLCTRAIWLERGELRMDGVVDEVATAYLNAIAAHDDGNIADRHDRTGNGAVRLTHVELLDAQGSKSRRFSSGQPVAIALSYEAQRPVGSVRITLFFDSSVGERVATLSNEYTDEELLDLPKSGSIICRMDGPPLNGGDYSVSATVKVSGITADQITDVLSFSVDGSSFYPSRRHPPLQGGATLLRAGWTVE